MFSSTLGKAAGGAALSAAAALTLASAPVQATVLTPGTPSCTASVTDPMYSACAGSFSGNLSGNAQTLQDVADTIQANFGSGYKLVGDSSSAPNGVFQNSPTGSSGEIILSYHVTAPFILGLKAATRFSLFQFNVDPKLSGGNYVIDFTTNGVSVNKRQIAQGLSHATLYVVPEPETYAALLAGLGILGFVARRRLQHLG